MQSTIPTPKMNINLVPESLPVMAGGQMSTKYAALKNDTAFVRTEKVHTLRQAAGLFGVSVATWKRYVAAGIVPAPVRIGPRRIGRLDSEFAATQDAWRQKRAMRLVTPG